MTNDNELGKTAHKKTSPPSPLPALRCQSAAMNGTSLNGRMIEKRQANRTTGRPDGTNRTGTTSGTSRGTDKPDEAMDDDGRRWNGELNGTDEPGR